MPHFFIILLKINLVLVLFAAAYYMVLRKLTFYVINRIFLLFGILFSTVYPFINLTSFFAQQETLPAFVPGLNQNISNLVQGDAFSLFWQALTLIFYAGVIFMASRLIIQFISLRSIHNNSNPGLIDNNKVRILNDEVSPFSFWQTIYVNPLLHKKEDLKNIIEHESVHVEEWHTLDIILAEISLVFYWFNPGVWLMKKAVRENIEFITDTKILKKGVDKKAYQYSLLGVGALHPSVAIVNNFNLSDLKKRIKMMNARRSSKVNLTRYVFVLPILLMVTLAFTVDKKDVEKTLAPIQNIVSNVMPDKKVELKRQETHINKKKNINSISKKIKVIDTIRNVNLVLHQEFKEGDSLRKVINLFTDGKQGEIPAGFKAAKQTSGKVFMSTFLFNDTSSRSENPQVRNIKIIMNTDKDSQYSFSNNDQVINMVKVIATRDASRDSLSVPGKKKHFFYSQSTTYTVDGNKVSAADLSKLATDQITKIIMTQNGVVDIKTKQK